VRLCGAAAAAAAAAGGGEGVANSGKHVRWLASLLSTRQTIRTNAAMREVSGKSHCEHAVGESIRETVTLSTPLSRMFVANVRLQRKYMRKRERERE